MKIAMMGIRGVPANYSGLETCAEEVGVRLVERGHEVVVYCRKGFHDNTDEYRGIRRIMLPSWGGMFTDTFSHTFCSALHVLRERPDVILAFNPAVSSLCLIPMLFGHKFCLNPDGFDWRRPKWPKVGQAFIYASAWLAAKTIHQMTIDAVSVRDYYAQVFGCRNEPMYIPNGANIALPEADDAAHVQGIMEKYGLEKGNYLLFLSRHVPDNSCELIIEAYEGLETDMLLFFVGGEAYNGTNTYAESLKNTQDERIQFPGPIYDPEEVRILHHHCYVLLHGNRPGGTSLGLLKALGYGTCVLTLDTPDNAYAIKDAGIVYDGSVEGLRAAMADVLRNPEQVQRLRAKAIARVKEEYLWDVVTDKYETALKKAAAQVP